MHTLFVSDLHLTPERPNTIKAFSDFLGSDAKAAQKLFILGDLFEYWIGDDAAQLVGAEPILRAMKHTSEHTECFFIAGNRDFLVRESFSEQSGFTILEDETVVDLYGTPTLLLHGDSLCVDDIAHQKFRQTMMCNRLFCDQFLSLSIPERIEKAKAARMESQSHKQNVSMEIMDVTEHAVIEAFKSSGVKRMIHGHTHRQNIHHYGDLERIVLGDWDKTSSVLKISESNSSLRNKEI